MTVANDSSARAVIPRWRTWNFTRFSGELASVAGLTGAGTLRERTNTDILETELSDRISSFVYSPGVFEAADVITTALVLDSNSDPGVARAAEFILSSESAPESTAALARRLLKGAEYTHPQKFDSTDYLEDVESITSLHGDIASLRNTLRHEPRNAVKWIDLARCYTALGQRRAAAKAIRMAEVLAPGNRFVVRSAARFHVHEDDCEQAHKLLVRSPTLQYDPWILAAEIAVADLADKPIKNFRRASKMLESDIDPRHLAELASALAAVEYEAGRVKQARRLLRQALRDPNDNALAQAEWSAQRGMDVVDPVQLMLPTGFEARALNSVRLGRFNDAVRHGRRWLSDQPFALDAAKFVTYVAPLLAEDYQSAIDAGKIGLLANPRDPSLINNQAFSLANNGEAARAARLLMDVPMGLSGREAGVLEATRGLVAYRQGQFSEGRQLYLRAIELLEKLGERGLAAVAALLWSREEMRVGSDMEDSFVIADRLAAQSPTDPDVEVLQRRLGTGVERYRRALAVRESASSDINDQ